MILCVTIIIFSGCKFNYSDSSEKNSTKNEESFEIAKRSIELIRLNNSDSLYKMLDKEIIGYVTKKDMENLIKDAQRILKSYSNPNDTSVLVVKSFNYSATGKKTFEIYSFPFVSKTCIDSVQYIHITVCNKKIFRLSTERLVPDITIMGDKAEK